MEFYKIKPEFLLLVGYLFFIFPYVLISGPTMSPDSYRYVEWADILIKNNFSISQLSEQADFYISFWQYLIPVSVIAISKLILENMWDYLYVALNVAALYFSGLLLIKIARLHVKNDRYISMMVFVYLASYDLVLWAKFILTDVYLIFFTALIFYFYSRFTSSQRSNYIFVTILFTALAQFVRPTALALASFVMVSFIANRFTVATQRFFFRPYGIIASLGLGSSAILLWVIYTSDLSNELIFYYRQYYTQGVVVHDRPETFINGIDNYLDFLHVFFVRVGYFFAFDFYGYSFIHACYNYLYYGFLYLSFLSLGYSVRHTFDIFKIYYLPAIGLVASVALFSSLTLIDYDFRYRIPILPVLILSIPFLLSHISKRVSQ